MLKKSSGSVKVYYPEHKREEVISVLKDYFSEKARKLKIREVYLFGSYARGNYTAHSDIDLFVVVEDNVNCDELYNYLRKTIKLRRLEILIFHVSDYERIKDSKWIKVIHNEGVKVY